MNYFKNIHKIGKGTHNVLQQAEENKRNIDIMKEDSWRRSQEYDEFKKNINATMQKNKADVDKKFDIYGNIINQNTNDLRELEIKIQRDSNAIVDEVFKNEERRVKDNSSIIDRIVSNDKKRQADMKNIKDMFSERDLRRQKDIEKIGTMFSDTEKNHQEIKNEV